ncbi:MAG: DUF2089 family protein [Planctomycetota bacterium]
MTKRIPRWCPSCDGKLDVTRLECPKCKTAIEGRFVLPTLARLHEDDQRFVLQFLRASGSLKETASVLDVSYPTVRTWLNEIIEHCDELEGEAGKG